MSSGPVASKGSAAPFRILVVCTANICRSVMAEQFLRRGAQARGLDVEVSSCGLLFDGEPASDTVLAVLEERDLDATDHRSRKFTPPLLDQADLVVTMERAHTRDLAVATAGSSDRIAVLGALVAWLRSPEAAEPGGTAQERLVAFSAGRRSSDALGTGIEEIEDPHGRSKRVHRKTADRLEELCEGLLDGLFGR